MELVYAYISDSSTLETLFLPTDLPYPDSKLGLLYFFFYYILICFVCSLSLGELLFLKRKPRREGVVDLEKMGDWRNWEVCTERKLWLICIIWQTTLFKMKKVYKEEKIKHKELFLMFLILKQKEMWIIHFDKK